MDISQINELVAKYIGIPYCLAGRDTNGLDCLGLIHLFYRDCGIQIPDGDGAPYTNDWVKEDPERYLRGILRQGRAVSLNDLKPLDLVYFRIGKYISHGGVMIDNQHFLHVLQNEVVHKSPLDFAWRRRLMGARRFVP